MGRGDGQVRTVGGAVLGVDEGAHLIEALGFRASAPHAGHDEGGLLVVEVDADVAAREAHEDGAVLLRAGGDTVPGQPGLHPVQSQSRLRAHGISRLLPGTGRGAGSVRMAPPGVCGATGCPAQGRWWHRTSRQNSMSEAMSATVSTWPAPTCALRTLPADAPRPLVEPGRRRRRASSPWPIPQARLVRRGLRRRWGHQDRPGVAPAPGPGSGPGHWRPIRPGSGTASPSARRSCSRGGRRPGLVVLCRCGQWARCARAVRWAAPEEAAPARPSALAADDQEGEELSWDFLRKPTMVVLSGMVSNGVGPGGWAGRNASGAPRRRAGRRRGPAGSTAPR